MILTAEGGLYRGVALGIIQHSCSLLLAQNPVTVQNSHENMLMAMLQLVTSTSVKARELRSIPISRLRSLRFASTDTATRRRLKLHHSPLAAFQEHLGRAQSREHEKAKVRQKVSSLCFPKI